MLSPLLFTILLEALSRPGFPEQLPYADDLALVSETLEGLETVIPSCASFADFGCIGDVVVLELN